MRSEVLTLDNLRIEVRFGGADGRAKLTIEPDGSLHLLAGPDVAIQELQLFLESKRRWIYTKLAAKEEVNRVPVVKELVDGESFQYLGRNYRLQIVDEELGGVRLVNGRLQLPARLRFSGKTPLVDWYCTTGRAWVGPKLKKWAEQLLVNPGVPEVSDLGRKWGSATAGGRVRMHWAVFQLDVALIDYVIAHELAHLREPHHGPMFWRVLGQALPDFTDRKTLLAHVGANLWFGQTQAPHRGDRNPRGQESLSLS